MKEPIIRNGVKLYNRVPINSGIYFYYNNARVVGSSRVGIVEITPDRELLGEGVGCFPLSRISNRRGILNKDCGDLYFSSLTVEQLVETIIRD